MRVVARTPVNGQPQAARPGAEWLPLVATVVLLAFYYIARADTIGVASPSRGWSPLTATPLPPALHFAASAFLLGALPVVVARQLTGLGLRQLGLGPGRQRAGLAWLCAGIPLAVAAGLIGSMSPAIRAVYPLDATLEPALHRFVPHALTQFLYYGAWEVLFRGVLLFGLKDRLGAWGANVLQTAISVTAHFGRPFQETLAAVPAGLVFGWVDLRIGSIWYLAVVHWLVGVSLDWFVVTT